MNQPANNKKLLDFLLYSYFGCESEDLAREGIQKCAYRAYLDLNRRIAFKYSSSELDKMQKDNTDLAKKYKEAKHNLVEKICSRILSSVILPRRILTRGHGALENAEADGFFPCRPPDRCGQAAVKIAERAELHISA